jgi:hypothetical protein
MNVLVCNVLLTQSKSLKDFSITFGSLATQVGEMPPALTNHFDQAAPGMFIVPVRL